MVENNLRHPLRDTFVFHRKWLLGIDMLQSDSDKAKVFTAISEYSLYSNCEISFDKPELNVIWAMIKDDIDKDIKKYTATCEKNQSNGRKGGRPKKDDNGTDENQTVSEKTKRFSDTRIKTERFSAKPKKADYDSDIDIEYEYDYDNEKDTDKDIILAVTDCESVFAVPLNDGSGYPIYQKDIDRWYELYPSVDVMQALRNIIGWCEANPTKRKTRKGVMRFINSWLSKEQDSGGNIGYIQSTKSNFTKVNPMDNLKKLKELYTTEESL